MQAMQYKINLPADYDMKIIKQRIMTNGHKTDGFKDLLFKAYLISEKDNDNIANSYCPLYIWRRTEGMTTFIFDGYYDNILTSFGWQNIHIGVVAQINLSDRFVQSKYMLEENFVIATQPQLKGFDFKHPTHQNQTGQIVIYNPDKWMYCIFTFFHEKPTLVNHNLYQVLHLSLGQ
ncbi:MULTISPECIES: DUF4865 family protein [unclassified Gilliamella]|uniref:DUF4865 family protein n=1 Tax=unclassified Gilliamella TaxID=2685620 RepID=UPI00226A88BB|nr:MULTISPECIES: DUF4865 family protein [unclassified Gilliamella]MCX8641914.1 DUF4865 family protein [Gilliamella sp. B3835]MCX8706714.1 DUF4865 family protein [Gilliamella sp. B3783]MCX8708817.1 DUF4865 family protein [Gilliamella sp. B3780]MCX8713157.1 DUF4865 family protein [Gilliamella sp. B3468]MCX8713601.1 DUF4865 family protein [Gilliamella sp. B3781]